MPDAHLHKTVSIFHLISLCFFLVSAGPFGQEEAMHAGGALYTFIATITIPFVFSLPLALISSEQATRLPACGGAVEWGLVLGKFGAHVNCYVRFLRSLSDNALYPVMVFDYLAQAIPAMDEWYWRLLVTFLSVGFAILCSVFGLEAVGWASFILGIVILLPFVLFIGFAAKLMTPARVFAKYPKEAGEPDLALLLSTVIWQFSGFDTVAAVSEEVANPRRTIPLAMFATVVLVTLVYLLPTMAGFAVEPDVNLWESGSFASAARKLPYCENGWLTFWLSISGAGASLSLCNVALSCTGREYYAGASFDAFPLSKYIAVLWTNFKGDPMPLKGILVMSALTVPFALLGFDWLVQWSGYLGVMTQVIQAIIFLLLRSQWYMNKIASRGIRKFEEGALEGSSDTAGYTAGNDVISIERVVDDNKFIIAGGWPVAILVVAALFASSGVLCYVSGWESLVVSVVLVIAMFALKGIEIGIVKLVKWCRSKECCAAIVEEQDGLKGELNPDAQE
jgi:amino acid transporter